MCMLHVQYASAILCPSLSSFCLAAFILIVAELASALEANFFWWHMRFLLVNWQSLNAAAQFR